MKIYVVGDNGKVLDLYTPPQAIRALVIALAFCRRVGKAAWGAAVNKDLGIGNLRVVPQDIQQHTWERVERSRTEADVVSALVNLGMRKRQSEAVVGRAMEDHGGKATFDSLLRASLARVPKYSAQKGGVA